MTFAEYWAAQPWLDCAGSLVPVAGIDWMRLCTFGPGFADFHGRGSGGFYISLLAGLLYLASALWLAFTRRASI